jgi:Tol biopolymer transport system component
VVLTTEQAIEAPNWMPDGRRLLFNGAGALFLIDLAGGLPVRIETRGLDDLNNDHVVSPDGATVYASSNDGHIYAIPTAGGQPRRVTNLRSEPFRHFVHGVSPDGRWLAYVGLEHMEGDRRANIFVISTTGSDDVRLTDWAAPSDGPEYSPDGEWIYFNSERGSRINGHAQIFRMNSRDGSEIEQLTFDDRVNWFPHVSPDDRHIVFLSYPPGTEGHPASRHVQLRLMSPGGGSQRTLTELFGGQGTINVNSWAPDSARLAYVAYPMAA